MDLDVQTRIEAFAFRKLVEHLQMRTDVQNIDVMNLAGFCRNCLAKWCACEIDVQLSRGSCILFDSKIGPQNSRPLSAHRGFG